MVSSFVLLTSLLGFAAAYPARYTDCGNGEIKSVDVEPCNSHPCVFRKGTNVKLTATFVANQRVTDAKLRVTVKLGENEVDFPGIDPEVCKYTPCPLEKGKQYQFTYTVFAQPWFPATSTTMKWLVKQGDSVVACAKADVQLE